MSKVIKTEIDSKRISAQMDQRVRKGRMMLKSEIARDCSPYLPFANGYLEKSVNRSIGKDDPYLVWDIIYARFLYYGKLMLGVSSHSAWAKKYERKVEKNTDLKYRKLRPQAGPYWFERRKPGRIQKWLKILETEVRKR